MKQIKFLGMLLLALTMCVSFSSCDGGGDEPKWDPNPAKTIAGTYVGEGKISYIVDLETWKGMKIEVVRSSNEYVVLTLRYANGDQLLADNRAFHVTETSNGYTLKDTEYPLTSIEISKKGEMTYYNPYISIGGESGYTITFTGKKEK